MSSFWSPVRVFGTVGQPQLFLDEGDTVRAVRFFDSQDADRFAKHFIHSKGGYKYSVHAALLH